MASPAQEPERVQALPFIPSASGALDRQGFVRVIDHSTEAGEVHIDAIDDEGESCGPVVLVIGAGEAVHFNSCDLENGNAAKGLSDGVGPGKGDWRLQLSSELDIEVLSYVRQPEDRTERANTTPVLPGTFAETPRYSGAVCEASGRTRVGTTKGRGGSDRREHYDEPKMATRRKALPKRLETHAQSPRIDRIGQARHARTERLCDVCRSWAAWRDTKERLRGPAFQSWCLRSLCVGEVGRAECGERRVT